MKGFSLCSGMGGFDIAMQALGVQCVGYCEKDRYAQAVLFARMRGGWLDNAPIWDDIETLEKSHVGNVQILYGGIPCQPHSIAGPRKRKNDERDLWPQTFRLLGAVRPKLFFLENVAGFSTQHNGEPAYAWTVFNDLASLGYDFRWVHVSASEIGAPHRRNRFFLLAHPVGESVRDVARSFGDPQRPKFIEGIQPERPKSNAGLCGENLGLASRCDYDELDDTNDARRKGRGRLFDFTDEVFTFPPSPDNREQWSAIVEQYPQLAPVLESGFRGSADGVAPRLDRYRRKRLEGLGNGIIPLQAIRAWEYLTGVLDD
jgi:DNA (cytosine-5)-methyltransferase 1